jgi:hypothetical protein
VYEKELPLKSSPGPDPVAAPPFVEVTSIVVAPTVTLASLDAVPMARDVTKPKPVISYATVGAHPEEQIISMS